MTAGISPDLSRPFRAFWLVLLVLAVVNGVLALRYTLPIVPFPAGIPNVAAHRGALIVHVTAGAGALVSGPWQFLPGLRRRRLRLHRLVGRLYAGCVLVSGAVGIPLALHAAAGAWSGFLLLSLAWLVTTGIALLRIVQGDVPAHRRWMVRSFALTAAAITLRLQLVTGLALHTSFASIYPVIAWTCWVPNLLVAEMWVAARRDRTRPAAAGV